MSRISKQYLVGCVVSNIHINRARTALVFSTHRGEIEAYTEAECCSETWIEHVETPALGFPCKVLEVANLKLRAELVEGEYEHSLTQYYGLKITTDKGDIVIDYRNLSNGYYGGSLEFTEFVDTLDNPRWASLLTT